MFVNSFDYSKVTNWDDAFTLPLQACERFFVLFLESPNKFPPSTSNSALLRDRIHDALFLARIRGLSFPPKLIILRAQTSIEAILALKNTIQLSKDETMLEGVTST